MITIGLVLLARPGAATTLVKLSLADDGASIVAKLWAALPDHRRFQMDGVIRVIGPREPIEFSIAPGCGLDFIDVLHEVLGGARLAGATAAVDVRDNPIVITYEPLFLGDEHAADPGKFKPLTKEQWDDVERAAKRSRPGPRCDDRLVDVYRDGRRLP